MSNENVSLTKVIVPCRFSYLHCWEPNAVSDGDPKYSVSAIIPKSDTETIGKIQRAIGFQVGREGPGEFEAAPAGRGY